MKPFNFRAWYNGDKPKIIFDMILEPNNEIYFYNKEHDISYEFYVPFVDTDWTVEQFINNKWEVLK